MRTFKFEKLVRDKIVPSMQVEGSIVAWRTLDEQEFIVELIKKLAEELDELGEGVGKNREHDVGELIDVAEVYETAWDIADQDEYYDDFEAAMTELERGIDTWEISAEELLAVKAAKIVRAGGFKKRTYIETVTVANDSPRLELYLANPKKYPELKDKLFDL